MFELRFHFFRHNSIISNASIEKPMQSFQRKKKSKVQINIDSTHKKKQIGVQLVRND